MRKYNVTRRQYGDFSRHSDEKIRNDFCSINKIYKNIYQIFCKVVGIKTEIFMYVIKSTNLLNSEIDMIKNSHSRVKKISEICINNYVSDHDVMNKYKTEYNIIFEKSKNLLMKS